MSFEDEAQEQELMHWELNNKARPAPVRYAPGDAGYGPEFCFECFDEMPAARREHGFTECAACKQAAEVKERSYRHRP